MVFVVAWCIQMGLSPIWAIAMWGLFPLISLVVARVVSEAGIFIYSHGLLSQTLPRAFGPEVVGLRNIPLMHMTAWAEVRSTGTQHLPYWMQSLRMISANRINRLHMLLAGFGAVVLTIFVCHVTALHIIYTWSIPKLASVEMAGSANEAVWRLLMTMGPGAKWQILPMISIGIGALIALFLVYMRRRYVLWPFHPLGYVAFFGWPTQRYWFSIFLGWLWKAAVARYFGFKVFSDTRPLAFGMIAGACVAISGFAILHFFVPGPPLVVD